jgi:hypothetical protein
MVRKAIRRADSGQVRIDVPKTASSVRVVTLPDPLATALGEHVEQFVSVEPGAWVFATSTGSSSARSNLGATLPELMTRHGGRQPSRRDGLPARPFGSGRPNDGCPGAGHGDVIWAGENPL